MTARVQCFTRYKDVSAPAIAKLYRQVVIAGIMPIINLHTFGSNLQDLRNRHRLEWRDPCDRGVPTTLEEAGESRHC